MEWRPGGGEPASSPASGVPPSARRPRRRPRRGRRGRGGGRVTDRIVPVTIPGGKPGAAHWPSHRDRPERRVRGAGGVDGVADGGAAEHGVGRCLIRSTTPSERNGGGNRHREPADRPGRRGALRGRGPSSDAEQASAAIPIPGGAAGPGPGDERAGASRDLTTSKMGLSEPRRGGGVSSQCIDN